MDKYDLGSLVGKGSFGSVLLVRRRSDGRPFVMKRLPLAGLSGASMESYRTEIQLLSELEHPGIVSYMESFVDRASMDLCIVMQFCEGGDLAAFIKSRQQQQSSSGSSSGSSGSSGGGAKLSESAIKSYFVQMCLALHYMHEKNILHRDIKTGNIFLTDSNRRLQLGDFGISKVLGGAQELASTCIGTPYYMSPELFKNKGYNHKSDVWALGCILYELTSLKHAFDAMNLNGLATKVIQGVYPPIATTYSRELRELIKSMLGVTPSSRPSVKQILLMPQLFKSIRKYIRSIVLQPQDSSNEDGEISSSGFRPAHVLNLRNQLDRLGPPLSGIFPEIERERAEKKSASGGAPSTGKAKSAAASSAAAAAAAAGSDLYDGADDDSAAAGDAIDRTLVAAAAVPGSHPPTIRRAARQPHHQRSGSNGRAPVKASDSASDDSPIAAAPAAVPGVGVRRHKGLQTRLAALDREHALRLEELRQEEEAKRKLEMDFERLQAMQAQRAAKRIQGRRGAAPSGRAAAPAPDASIASTVTTSSAGSTASGSAAANLPIIAAPSSSGANGSVSPLSPPMPASVSFTSSMAALPSLSALQQQQQPGQSQPMSSRESSRHASPALGPHRLNKGANRMPAMVLGAPVVATGGIGRSASPAPQPPPPQPPLHGGLPSASPTAGGVAVGTASGSNSAAPSPRFASRRLAAAVASGAAVPSASAVGDESKESNGSGNFRSASPRTVSASPQPPSASAAPSGATGADENRHLKLLKRKAALKAAPPAGVASALSPSEHAISAVARGSRSQVPSPELGSASAPPPRITGIASVPRVTGGAGRPRVAHPIMVPLSSAAAPSSSPSSVAAGAAVLSPGSVLESEVAAERAELARLRVERERLEDLLTKMDDVLFEGQLDPQPLSAAAGSGAKSPYSGSAEIDTPTHGSASAPPAVSTAQRSSGPVLHSPPSGAGAPSSFSASTILPSAFDAPLQYRGRVAAAPGPTASAAAVALKQLRRHSAQNAGLMLDAAAAQSSAMQQQQQYHHPSAPSSIAPRHRTFAHPSSAGGGGGSGPVTGFPPNSVFSPASASAGAQSSSRDRILAMKASRKVDGEAAEAARLLAARREYFNERTKADQRTKDFYGNSANTGGGFAQSHRSPSPGASPPPPPDPDTMQRHQSDPLSYPGSRYPPSSSSASASAAAIAADHLLIYDDRHLHLHLNTDLSPTGHARAGGAAADDRDLQPSYPSAADVSAEDADPNDATVREFKHHLAQYTRRIETLRSAIEVSATALASRGADRGALTGTAGEESAEQSEEDASDDDDDDDEPERSGEDADEYDDESQSTPVFNLADRRKALAAECVSLLGRSAFIAAYDFLVDAQRDPAYANDSLDDARKIEKLTSILGADRVKHWKLIDQLIFMESC